MASTRCSNAVFAAFNIVTLLLGAAVLAAGIYYGSHGECERFLRAPALAGACCRGATPLLWLYLALTGLLIAAAVCLGVFALVVTNAGAGRAVSGRGFKEYRLGDYSTWLRRRVEDGGHWARIRSCLVDAGFCGRLGKNRTVDEFVNSNLSPVQSGCCKPPTECNFTYQNETYWIKPPGSRNYTDPDCNSWSNEQSELCYDCQSCKAGVLGNLRSSWKKIAFVNAAFVALLVIVYSLGCCALRNNRRHKYSLVGK
uniref:Tetraspanin n=1 Tax=Leersia perrieri TaxID=77586 RepID=A0A0D9X5Y6_9ORYZ